MHQPIQLQNATTLFSPMRTIILVTFIAFAALCGGCASSGTKVEQSALSKIIKGKTTKSEVIALLGNPMSAQLTGNGKEIDTWSYAQAQAKGRSFIPVVGAFVGGSDMKLQTFQVILNKNKVVEDYLWNDSNIELRMGG